MTLEERVDALEQLVNRLIDLEVGNKQYTDADIAGCRQGISEVTPWEETKTAYFNETEKTYYGVPVGNISVFFDNYNGEWSVDRISDRLTVHFNRLNAQTNITLSIN